MKTIKTKLLIAGMLLLGAANATLAQGQVWKLEDCIRYALGKNIQVQKADLTNNQNQLYSEQAQAGRLPSLNASVNQNFNWSKGFDSTTGTSVTGKGTNSTNYAVNSNLTLFNGEKITNKVKLADLDLQSGRFNSAAVKESVGLNILNAYLQVLYAKESVSNAEKQIESTTEQLALAKERMDQGVISIADYLQIKSELANEKSTLASAKSQLAITKVTLMQLMELPVTSDFEIGSPNLDSLLVNTPQPDAKVIYAQALGFKPEIKSAELNKEASNLNVKIARADFLPSLSMGLGLTTGYSSLMSMDYTGQLKDKVSPSIGFSLSIPIFQKKQVLTNVGVAKIAVSNAELDLLNTRNTLRKEIEQACVDMMTVQSEYSASMEQLKSSTESYNVVEEKYKVGLVNAVDFLVQKTSLITSESKLLQSKYKLVFSNKVLDFYKGIPLVL